MDYITLANENGIYTGALYRFESELMKIIVKDPTQFSIGENIACTYANIKFQSKILKKQDNHIYILVPQTNKYFPNEKRKHPRITVHKKGILLYDKEPYKLKVNIVDLSRMGFGIRLSKEYGVIKVNDVCKLFVNLEKNELSANVIIRNKELIDNEYRYGCEIQKISDVNEFELRKFILSEQLKRNMIY